MPYTVSIIIVSYKCAEVLRNCLHSVRQEMQRHSYEIIVVDNASEDTTISMLGEEFPEVTVIANPENRGFAAANNQGLQEACGEYILFLNPDTIILNGAIDTMMDVLVARPDVGLTGPHMYCADGQTTLKTVFHERTLMTTFHWHIPLWKWIPFYYPPSNDTYAPPITTEVKTVQGSCMLLSAALAREIGGMDERFFMFSEEHILCNAIRTRRLNILYCREASIIHLEGASTGIEKEPITERRLAMSVEILRSLKKFHALQYPGSSLWGLRFILLAGCLWRLLLFTGIVLFFPSKRQRARGRQKEQWARLQWLLKEYA